MVNARWMVDRLPMSYRVVVNVPQVLCPSSPNPVRKAIDRISLSHSALTEYMLCCWRRVFQMGDMKS